MDSNEIISSLEKLSKNDVKQWLIIKRDVLGYYFKSSDIDIKNIIAKECELIENEIKKYDKSNN